MHVQVREHYEFSGGSVYFYIQVPWFSFVLVLFLVQYNWCLFANYIIACVIGIQLSQILWYIERAIANKSVERDLLIIDYPLQYGIGIDIGMI